MRAQRLGMKQPDIEELPEYEEMFQKLVEAMPLEKRLAGLTLEQRLAGLTPEQVILLLPVEVLRMLSPVAPRRRSGDGQAAPPGHRPVTRGSRAQGPVDAPSRTTSPA
ncbi:hypothetical protein BE20_07395 [Sorangium cellulosum]|nr:hypothetical protein BE20_07395 [Sorangium cellulosum]